MNDGSYTGVIAFKNYDSVYLEEASSASGDKENLFVELGTLIGSDKNAKGLYGDQDVAFYEKTDDSTDWEEKNIFLLGIYNGAENFNVQGKATYGEDLFEKYTLTPKISVIEGAFKGKETTESALKETVGTQTENYKKLNEAYLSAKEAYEKLAGSASAGGGAGTSETSGEGVRAPDPLGAKPSMPMAEILEPVPVYEGTLPEGDAPDQPNLDTDLQKPYRAKALFQNFYQTEYKKANGKNPTAEEKNAAWEAWQNSKYYYDNKGNKGTGTGEYNYSYPSVVITWINKNIAYDNWVAANEEYKNWNDTVLAPYTEKVTAAQKKYSEEYANYLKVKAAYDKAEASYEEAQTAYEAYRKALKEYEDYLDTWYGAAYYLSGYDYQSLGASESMKSAADNTVAFRNLWRNAYTSMFRRTGALHHGLTKPLTEKARAEGREYLRDDASEENVWADVWHGQYKSDSGYGRAVKQTYNGLTAGYDKMFTKDYFNGRMYAGVYAGKITSSVTTESGKGSPSAENIGAYASWVGNKGHYLDMGILASKMEGKYHFNDLHGYVDTKYPVWAYAAGVQYGYRKYAGNWFIEPQAALYMGRMAAHDYTLSNKLNIHVGAAPLLTGKLGLAIGRNLEEHGNLYLNAAVVKEFKDGPEVTASYDGSKISGQTKYGKRTASVDVPNGKDTWYELGLGGNLRFSPDRNLNVDVTRSFGRETGDEWRINAKLEFSWGGSFNRRKEEKEAKEGMTEISSASVPAAAAFTAGSGENGNAVPAEPGYTEKPAEAIPRDDTQNVPEAAAVDTSVYTYTPGDAAGQTVSHADGVYELSGVTVEAPRPKWEREYSPGSVSVIYPEKFEGEQKTLPDLLEQTTGVWVQRINGVGHYTVARVRGSAASQVNVYVDGVLMNLNGDAAVNLSNIPMENVERVEVYRGYIPARFSASPIGGVINIVTKKPKKAGGMVSQGIRSFGGYTGNYEYNMPVGDGSLLVTYGRDIWTGDFPIDFHEQDGSWSDYHRKGNAYRRNNGMAKWQDDHWMVKAAWKDNMEQLSSVNDWDTVDVEADRQEMTKRVQRIKEKEFQFGRRDTVGKLDWGWRVGYLDSRKRHTYPYLIEYNRALEERGFSPIGDPGAEWAEYHSKKWFANLNFSRPMANHLLEFNFDYSNEKMDADGFHWERPLYGLPYLHRYTIKEYHAALQDTIQLNSSGDLKLTPMVRADKVDMGTPNGFGRTDWKYSAQAAITKDIGDAWTLKASYGTYNRHPNFYEIFGDGATLATNRSATGKYDPWETGQQGDISVNWRGNFLGAKADFTTSYYQRRSKNLLMLAVRPQGLPIYINAAKGKAKGVEINGNLQWKHVNLNVAATYTDSKYTQLPYRMYFSSYMPQWLVHARLDYTFSGERVGLFLDYNYSDEILTSYVERASGNLTSLSTWGMGIKTRLGKDFRLTAYVNDIFDKARNQKRWHRNLGTGEVSTEAPYYPMAGRTYYVTVGYSF